MFGDRVTTEAVAHANEAYPNEACGFIVSGQYVRCQNIHEEPLNNFRISPKEYIKYKDIQGVVHSHPKGNKCPSKNDILSQISSNVPWGIVAKGTVTWFGWDVPIAPLLNREFIHGVYDCATIVRDWYRLNTEIDLKPIPSIIPDRWDWWKTSSKEGDATLEYIRSFGFVDAVGPAEVGDILMGAFTTDNLSHFAVICKPGMILQHFPNRLSDMQPLGRWEKCFSVRLRKEGGI